MGPSIQQIYAGSLQPTDQIDGDSLREPGGNGSNLQNNAKQFKVSNKIKQGAATSTNFMKNNISN